MNLAVSQSTRHHLKNNDVRELLSRIAKYSSTPTSSISDEEKQKDLQCLKAVSFVIFSYRGTFLLSLDSPGNITFCRHM